VLFRTKLSTLPSQARLGFDRHHYPSHLLGISSPRPECQRRPNTPTDGRHRRQERFSPMQGFHLPALEFIAFISFAVWLFWYQRKSSRRRDDDEQP
jgi:hypothetical protein